MNSCITASYLTEHCADGLRIDVLEELIRQHLNGQILNQQFSCENGKPLSVQKGTPVSYEIKGAGSKQKIVVRFAKRYILTTGGKWEENNELSHEFTDIPNYLVIAHGNGSHPLTIFHPPLSFYANGDRVEFYPPEKQTPPA